MVAQAEAMRCLECGCHDFEDCKLIRYANMLQADVKRLRGQLPHRRAEGDRIDRN